MTVALEAKNTQTSKMLKAFFFQMAILNVQFTLE